ncbi:hypothetical protein F2Q69_00059567 [Brassica cretica]|uniref:Uncharacterized protein n=1 Tax=Brassica cretica TaxID=69181 RepID=A0A8S9RC74_BRACR|nr:hypothetical protein F2Q69_00059567 [Brassica cretica]
MALKWSACGEMRERSWVFIEDNSQSDSGWWPPVCRSAWLRSHAQWHLVLHMAFSMARTHAGRHHSSQISGCMTRTHARRHSSSHMAGRMLRLHVRRHLVLLHVSPYAHVACAATPHDSLAL